jgi:predicted dehydrogenase
MSQNRKRTQEAGVSRRRFLKNAAGASLGALAIPTIVPSSALGADGTIAPSNRIVMGAIGVGSQGTGDMRGIMSKDEVQYVAVCDVDKGHRDRAKGIVDAKYGNTDCVAYADFREILGRGDLDGVSLALPDHWHALIGVAAAEAGCDIYGEKPLARSIRGGRAICDAVHRHGRVWQTGSWQRSVDHFYRACMLVRNGRIGKIQKVEVGLPTGGTAGPNPIQPVPPNLDWNFWLGPAPYVPFRGVVHWNWRWIMDYSGGQLTDWAGHHIDIAHWGLGKDATGPVEIWGKGEYPHEGLYTAPTAYKFHCLYADGVTFTVANNQQIPMGAKWYGEDGWVHVNRGGINAEPKSLLNEKFGAGDVQIYKSNDHVQNFLDCVKSRELTITPVETAHRSISVGLLGEIAMLTGRKIKWDPDKEEIQNDPGASALLGRSYREPWTL